MQQETDSHPWYSMADLPRGRVRVRVRWAGYQVIAVSDVDKRGMRHWHELRGRELVPMVGVPQAWQPENPGLWLWPNGIQPLALPVRVKPKLSTVGGLEFDAVQARLEMEEWREAARARSPDQNEPTVGSSQWWRDASLVRYEPQGEITVEMAEARVMRHLVLERALPPDLRRLRTNAAVLADLKRSWADVASEQARGGDWIPPMPTVDEDWEDFETVMSWLVESTVGWRAMIVLRARAGSPPETWDRIGNEIKRSAQRAGQIYRETIERLAAAANGRPERAPREIAALRERNRQARGR